MKITTVDGKNVPVPVARKVLHLQVECGGALSEATMDSIAKDLIVHNRVMGPVLPEDRTT